VQVVAFWGVATIALVLKFLIALIFLNSNFRMKFFEIAMAVFLVVFSALTLLVGWQEGRPASQKYGGMVEVGTG